MQYSIKITFYYDVLDNIKMLRVFKGCQKIDYSSANLKK